MDQLDATLREYELRIEQGDETAIHERASFLEARPKREAQFGDYTRAEKIALVRANVPEPTANSVSFDVVCEKVRVQSNIQAAITRSEETSAIEAEARAKRTAERAAVRSARRPKRPAVDRFIPRANRRAVKKRRICEYCGDVNVEFHVDHWWPASSGGTGDLENLVCACATCNLKKSDTKPGRVWVKRYTRSPNGLVLPIDPVYFYANAA